MKKALRFVLPIVVIVVVMCVYVGVSVVNSPEYALWQISKDVEQNGMEGLVPHLTDEAQSVVTVVKENKMVGSVLRLLGQSEYTNMLETNLAEVEWSLQDIVEGKYGTTAVLGFNYNNKLVGTINVKMVEENGEWKISGWENPSFAKISLA